MNSSTKNDGENMKKFMFDTNDFDKQPEPEPEDAAAEPAAVSESE